MFKSLEQITFVSRGGGGGVGVLTLTPGIGGGGRVQRSIADNNESWIFYISDQWSTILIDWFSQSCHVKGLTVV